MRRACLLCLLIAACSGSGPEGQPPPADAGNQSHAGAVLKACAAIQSPPTVNTLFSAVARLNALPAPATPACFVAGLPRPLDVVATTSVVSAQPAAGRLSPRLFLLLPGMVVSVVPDGAGAKLVELAEWDGPTRTLKGEVEFPLSSPLAADAPLARVHPSQGTTSCGLCHRNELPHSSIDGGFVSDAFRPDPGTLVPVSEVSAQHAACLETDLSDRCVLLHALFDFGEVRQGAFSRDLALFVQ